MEAASAVRTAVNSSKPASFASLVCPTLQSFANVLDPNQRLVGLDISPTHLSLSMSSYDQTRAYPWAIITRADNAHADASILEKGIREAEKMQGGTYLNITGLVVGWNSGGDDSEAGNYLKELVEYTDSMEGRRNFESLAGILFYNEELVIKRCRQMLKDFRKAASRIPERVERRRNVKYLLAMNPRELTDDEQLMSEVKMKLSASDILQAALDDLNRLRR